MSMSDLQNFVVRRDGAPDLQFLGLQLASVSSRQGLDRQDKPYWTELRLYRTAGHQYVAEQVGVSTKPGHTDRSEAQVCESAEAVADYLGYGWLAKKLYEAANLNVAETVA